MRRSHLHATRAALGAGAIAILGLTAACADVSTAPANVPTPGATPSQNLVSQHVVANALTRTTPLPNPISISAVIGPAGGSIEIPKAGVKLTVDAGTVGTPTTFTVTALAGRVVAYDFTPEGAYHTGGLKITQSLVGTNADALQKNRDKKELASVEGGYFSQAADLDHARGTARVREFVPAVGDLKTKKVEFRVKHFSGYMVSMGRHSSY